MQHLKLIQQQCADAQNDKGLLPTHTVGKILGWGLPRQTTVYAATKRDTILGSVIGDVTYDGYGCIKYGDYRDRIHNPLFTQNPEWPKHPFPSPVIEGYFRANDVIQWVAVIIESEITPPQPPPEPQKPLAPEAERKWWWLRRAKS